MVFRGTVIVRGRLEVCVTATGLRTELGKIAQLVADVRPPPTPLERSMTQLGRLLGIVVLVLCAIIFTVGVLRGLRLPELLLAAASLAVSAVPEGLPAIVTVSLALGVQRMIRRRVLTRRLHAIETLGSVTVICTDKTGTVTENRMEVQEVWVQGGEPAVEQRALQIGASCNNAHSLDVGDPTEIGLLAAAERRGVRRLPILREDQPFTAEEKYMVTTHRIDGEELQYLKGAPERLLSLSTHHLSGDAVHPLTEEDRMEILRKSDAMASRALRVLAVGEQQGEQTLFIGLVGLLDPPRTGVAEAIERACAAGIRTILITGDHALTACAIAQRVGISGEVVVGATLDTLSEGELQECVGRASVFARVTPLHKVRILEALQKRGEVVAMGGDGVNDAPALRKAHVGFAMGKQGTDVARDTADIVLTDDHYASVVEAIEEGRTIYDNVRKFITFLLRANFDELLVVLGAMLFGIPLPYLPVHILLINLLTDSLPAMALALEAPEGNVMCRPPRDPKEHLLSGEYTFIGLAAIIAAIAAFHVFTTTWGAVGEDLARSMTLTTAILFELTLVFTCRSKESLFRIGLFSNHALLGAVAIAFFFLLLLLYTPLAPFVHLLPLSPAQWMLPLVWSIGALLFFELLKLLRYNDTICPRGSRSSSSGS
jgi:Ca2+-transporting ATPase